MIFELYCVPKYFLSPIRSFKIYRSLSKFSANEDTSIPYFLHPWWEFDHVVGAYSGSVKDLSKADYLVLGVPQDLVFLLSLGGVGDLILLSGILLGKVVGLGVCYY